MKHKCISSPATIELELSMFRNYPMEYLIVWIQRLAARSCQKEKDPCRSEGPTEKGG
jgi:hypothetical protein